ncbi:c-type cytochrome [bacterium]|nr:c-type cytochrome [bacterium]
MLDTRSVSVSRLRKAGRHLTVREIAVNPVAKVCQAGIALLVFLAGTCLSNVPEVQAQDAKRPAWTTSRVKGSPEPPLPYRAQRVFPHLGFTQPTVLTSAPETERLFVAEQSGRIYSIPDDRDCRQPDLFLDVRQLVEKLNGSLADDDKVSPGAVYGLTFHPDFATNRKFYVCYVVSYRKGGRGQHPHGTRVVQLLADHSDPPQAVLDSEVEIISWLQGGHNGGCLKFGLDGMLYISAGDGGNAFPPDGLTSGQDVTNLLSSVMRIDVNRRSEELAYAIPDDNPFVAATTKATVTAKGSEGATVEAALVLPEGTRKEIWAYGMRNPWKMSFDRKTGDLWVGDVGWELWELVYRVHPGDNYGWSLVEGHQPVRPEQRPGPTPVTPPAVEIPHTEAASITGGFVYRGKRLPELDGHYIFGDWETRRFWSVRVDGGKVGPRRELVEPTVRIVGFAERNDGELLLLDYDDGSIHELVRNEVPANEFEFPRRLSQTGLFESVTEHSPASGVVPFSINAAQWGDHAESERWLGLPGETSIGIHDQANQVAGSMFRRVMDYPNDAVLMKTLSLELTAGDPATKRRIETQLLHFNGYDWRGYSYRWNEDQTDAELVDATGSTATFRVVDSDAPGGVRHQTWRFSSRTECIRCHNPWAEFSLAFNTAQLNRPVAGGTDQNQLEHLYSLGVLHDVPPDVSPDDKFAVIKDPVPPRERPHLVDPFDASADLTQRARSYLHINCAHCHRFNGGGSARIYLPFDQPIYKTEAVDTRPSQGAFGIDDARIIAPGDPFRSVLYFRVAKTGAGHMPHLGSRLIDETGLQLVHDWIQQLPPDIPLAEKIDELAALDEPTILQTEQGDAAFVQWTIARGIATRDGRDLPTQNDMDTALTQAQQQANGRAVQRAKRRTDLTAELLSTARGAVALRRALQNDRLTPTLSELVIKAATQHDNIAVRDLFESFIPDDQRIERLGDSINATQLLAMPGDVARGRDLFLNASGVSCRNCHRVGTQGKSVGPELTQIGKRLDRAKLLESLLEPSKTIDPKFATWLVQTSSGKVLSGLLIEQSDTKVILRDAQNKDHEIPADDIEEIFRQRTSLMPERLLRDLTPQQAADLLAWLESLQ